MKDMKEALQITVPTEDEAGERWASLESQRDLSPGTSVGVCEQPTARALAAGFTKLSATDSMP